jgi:hypothetical protein
MKPEMERIEEDFKIFIRIQQFKSESLFIYPIRVIRVQKSSSYNKNGAVSSISKKLDPTPF